MSQDCFTQENVDTVLARIPFAQTLGIKPLLMGQELTLILPYAPHIIGNPILRALHGGAVGAFMETTAIVQLAVQNCDISLPKPIGINIDFMRRGHPKDTFARAIVARQGSRVANVRVAAWQDNRMEPISTLHGNFLTGKDKDEVS